MSLSLFTAALLALAQGSGTVSPVSAEELLALSNLQGRLVEAHFQCIYNYNKSATEQLVATSDSYFYLDEANAAATSFAKSIPGELVNFDCLAKAAVAVPEMQQGTVSFSLRRYRDWAARRIYLDRFPAPPIFGKLKAPNRFASSHGKSDGAIEGFLTATDCAVRRDPANADWLVRNVDPNRSQNSQIVDNRLELFMENYRKCGNRFTPLVGPARISAPPRS